MKLMPFFTYFGGKHRATKHYPPPKHDRVIEPFAGAAGYSVNYYDRKVILRDLNPVVVETWQYLISADPEEVYALPDLEVGQTTDDLNVPVGAKHLIGWWLNKGTARPRKSPTTFMLQYPQGGPYWGERIRERIATQVPLIRHWKVSCGSYEDLPDKKATWYVDPPYQKAGGKGYPFGNNRIDYDALGEWCKKRRGQLIVCEGDDADWLPFRPLVPMDNMEGRQKISRAKMEMIYP